MTHLTRTTALLLALVATARATPLVVTHTGFLLDATDAPITSPGLAMKFRIFAHPLGTSAAELVWESNFCNVVVTRGYYATTLGEACQSASDPLQSTHLPSSSARYLEVVLEAVTLAPRMLIATVPTAAVATTSLDAQALETALKTAGTVNDAANPVDWTKLKNVPAGAGLQLSSGALGVAPGGVANAMLANAAVSVNAGTGLAGGGSVALGGATLLSLADTAVTPGTYTLAAITVDQQGRITSAQTGAAGTVTSVASGAGLTGGPVTSSGTISIANEGVTSAMLASDAAGLAKVSGGAVSTNAGALEIAAGNAVVANSRFYAGKTASGTAMNLMGVDSSGFMQVGPGVDGLSGIRVFPSAASGEVMRLATSGNVGINQTNPATKLDVGGEINLQVVNGQYTRLSGNLNDPALLMRVTGDSNHPNGYLSGGWAGNSVSMSSNSFYRYASGVWSTPNSTTAPSWAVRIQGCGSACGPTDKFEILRGSPVSSGPPAMTALLTVDQNGARTTPRQPGMMEYINSVTDGANRFLAGTDYIDRYSSNYNIGGAWDRASGRFTVPVSGRYLVNVHIMCQNTGTTMDFRLYKNGTTNFARTYANTGTSYKLGTMDGVWQFAAGDYIQLKQLGGCGVYEDDSWMSINLMD